MSGAEQCCQKHPNLFDLCVQHFALGKGACLATQRDLRESSKETIASVHGCVHVCVLVWLWLYVSVCGCVSCCGLCLPVCGCVCLCVVVWAVVGCVCLCVAFVVCGCVVVRGWLDSPGIL